MRPAAGDLLRQRPRTSRNFFAWELEWKIELRDMQPGRVI